MLVCNYREIKDKRPPTYEDLRLLWNLMCEYEERKNSKQHCLSEALRTVRGRGTLK